MTDMPPPAPVSPPVPGRSASPATRADRLRLYLILGGIAAFLVIVLFMIRNNQSAGDLAVGTCFNLPSAGGDVSTVERRDCTEAHDAEVIHVTELTEATSYPISLTLERFIDERCVPAFATYVGVAYDTSPDYAISIFYPSRDGWDAGDRTVTCYVGRADDAKLTTSVRSPAGS